MAESRGDVAALERALVALAPAIDLPSDPGPAFAVDVRRRLEAEPESVLRRVAWPSLGRRMPPVGRPARRSFVVALAVVVLAAAAAAAATLGVRGIRIVFGPPSAPPAPATAPSGGPATSVAPTLPTPPLGQLLITGRHVTLEEARRLVSFRVWLPFAPGLARPEVYLDEEVPGGMVELVYPASPGLPAVGDGGVGMVLSELVGRVDRPSLQKFVFGGATVEEVTVGGAPGLWVEGVHEIGYLGPQGQFLVGTLRLSDSALLWQRGDVTLRLESGLPKGAAVTLGASVR